MKEKHSMFTNERRTNMEQYAESGNTIEFKKMQRKLKREAFKRKVTDTAKNLLTKTKQS